MKDRAALLCALPALAFAVFATSACSRPTGSFSEQNARAHIGMLAGTIGSRPIGTPANARARTYIVDELHNAGFEVRVQETDARRGSIGRTAHVHNIIATKAGRRSEAIGLVSHYDSVTAGPGAADDGLGVGVALEAARVLGGLKDRQWTLMVLVTDGEEASMMGAAALVTDRDLMRQLHAYINVESIGSAGPPTLFEVGPGNAWLLGPWARRAPGPRGASFVTEVYRRLPNDTDFSILKRQDIPGLNFAAVGDSYAYHTPRDTPERLSLATIRDTGEQVVSIVTALEGMDITQRTTADRTFFDVGGMTAISYGPVVGWIIAGAALLFGVVAWVRMTAAAIRIGGTVRWLLMAVWAIIGAAAVVLSMIGATWTMRAAHAVYHPWYARPGRLFLLMLAAGVSTAWLFARLGHWLPPRAHGVRGPAVVWSIALPLWLATASGSLWVAPGAAFLWLIPLLTAGVLLSIVPASAAVALRLVSIIVFAVAATLWVRDTTNLLYFMVAALGRFPLVTPIAVFAAVMSIAGAMLAPPLIAAIGTTQPLLRPSLASAVCLAAIAVTAGFAYSAPAYTYEQPLRRQARVIQEQGGPPVWEVGSVEPGLDLGDGAPSGWTPAPPGSSPASSAVPVLRLPYPFVFRATGPDLGPAPITIAGATIDPLSAGQELAITVVPREPGIAISFVLPAGLQPARSSLPGVPRLGHWMATYVAPPPEGVIFRASFNGADAARLREVRVLATMQGSPDGRGWGLPAWLPQERTVWTADATWTVAPFSLPIAPVPPLR
jgi:hypothetical protein